MNPKDPEHCKKHAAWIHAVECYASEPRATFLNFKLVHAHTAQRHVYNVYPHYKSEPSHTGLPNYSTSAI